MDKDYITLPRTKERLDRGDLAIIFDILNVYDPNDIKHVYPEMGDETFLAEVRGIWSKLLRETEGFEYSY